MRERLAIWALWGTLAVLLVLAFDNAMSLPTVYKSWSTQECLRVDDPEGKHDCGNLPEQYDLVWME